MTAMAMLVDLGAFLALLWLGLHFLGRQEELLGAVAIIGGVYFLASMVVEAAESIFGREET